MYSSEASAFWASSEGQRLQSDMAPDLPECPHCSELVVDCECAWDTSGPAFESRNRALR